MSSQNSPSLGLTFKFGNNRTLKRVATFLSLAITVAILWGIIFDRWRPNDWGTPLDYSGDALLSMSMMKHAANGDLHLFGPINSEKVGAPYVGNLNDFPLSERPMFYLGGLLSRFIGLGPAMNFLVISAHILAAFSFYTAARLWRIARPFAWSFALPYAFIPYALIVSDAQLPLLFYGLLPLQLYCTWYLSFTPNLSWKDTRFRLSLIIAFLTALVHVYLILPFIILNIFSLFRRLANHKSYFSLASVPLVVTFLIGLITLSGHLFYWLENGMPEAVLRQYNHLEIGALKPTDLILPSPHHAFGLLDSLHEKYLAQGAYTTSESFRAYLGLLAILGIFLLVFRSAHKVAIGASLPLPAIIVLFFLLYSSFGGLNSIISLFSNIYLMRTTVRYSYVIGTIGLLYLALYLSRHTKNLWTPLRILIAFSLALIGLMDQAYPSLIRAQSLPPKDIKTKIRSDKKLAQTLENKLPPDSSLFILPYMPFPEAQPLHRLGDYELSRPFLHSSHLRFSYGSHRGRPSSDWQLNLIQNPIEEIISDLESYGFSGVLINRLAYPDEGNSLIEGFRNQGRPPSFDHENQWVFIPLSPVASPSLPPVAPALVGSWFALEGGNQHWWAWRSERIGEVNIYSTQKDVYDLNFTLKTLSPRDITIELNGQPIRTLNFTSLRSIPLSLTTELREGKNILIFSTNQPATGLGHSFSTPKVSFGIENFKVNLIKETAWDFSNHWFAPEGTPPNQWRWTGEVTGSKITIYSRKSGKHQFNCSILSPSKRNIYFSFNNEIVNKLSFPQPEEKSVTFTVELKQGYNEFVLSSDEPPIPPAAHDSRPLAFYIKGWTIQEAE